MRICLIANRDQKRTTKLPDYPRQCPFKKGFTPPTTAASNEANGSTTTLSTDPVATFGNLPAYLIESLPTFIHERRHDKHRGINYREVLPIDKPDNFEKLLEAELDLRRINDIHGELWMCGRPMNARPLHEQLLQGRRLLVTKRMDLHLLYYSDIIMIKPLPLYLLNEDVWKTYLCKQGDDEITTLHQNACGLLLSYTWLIRSVDDFNIAQAEFQQKLLPADMTWQEWRRIAMETLDYIDTDALYHVNRRFQFGELRLGRINNIYRLNPRFIFRYFVRGYLYNYNRYKPFLQRHVSWLLGVSVLFSLVLSAMQVGSAVDPLKDNPAFNQASYGFVVFSSVLVAGTISFVVIIFTFIYLHNMVVAIVHSRQEQQRRNAVAKEKLDRGKHA